MSKRLTTNNGNKLTHCTADEGNIGKDRCNHIVPQNPHESPEDFCERCFGTQIFSEENINKKKDILKNKLTPYIENEDVTLEISIDSKIYISVKEDVKNRFMEDFKPYINIYEDRVFDYEDEEGWFSFDYLALYDAVIDKDDWMISLAFAIEDLGLGEVPEIIKMELEDDF